MEQQPLNKISYEVTYGDHLIRQMDNYAEMLHRIDASLSNTEGLREENLNELYESRQHIEQTLDSLLAHAERLGILSPGLDPEV